MCIRDRTYIIPAGEFAVDENGKILGDQFSYLGHQNPVAPWRMFMLILQGLGDSGLVIWTVLTSGAMTAVVMATGAIDELLNWAIYKLKDKSENILITIMLDVYKRQPQRCLHGRSDTGRHLPYAGPYQFL